jgi:hypothetical protein
MTMVSCLTTSMAISRQASPRGTTSSEWRTRTIRSSCSVVHPEEPFSNKSMLKRFFFDKRTANIFTFLHQNPKPPVFPPIKQVEPYNKFYPFVQRWYWDKTGGGALDEVFTLIKDKIAKKKNTKECTTTVVPKKVAASKAFVKRVAPKKKAAPNQPARKKTKSAPSRRMKKTSDTESNSYWLE